jgi:uncharacterized protein YndB with AHSA1/START domain
MTNDNTTASAANEATIAVDADVPLVRIVREFDAPPVRVFRAHVDPDLFSRWNGPDDTVMKVDHFDCRTGGAYRYTIISDGAEHGFRGSFHEVREDQLIVQTFTWEGMPDGVALEKLTFEALDGGRTRLTTTSLVDSFEARDGFVASGMETGVQEGYRRLDAVLAAG